MAIERKKIFLCLARPSSDISEHETNRYKQISKQLGEKLAKSPYDIIFAGNVGSFSETAADAFMNSVGDDNKNRIVTYLPRKPYEKEYSHHGWEYKPLGTTLVIDEYPEQRRFRMVKNCDIMLLIGGKEGSAQDVVIADLLNKPLIPVPHFGGIARTEYEKLINKLEKEGNSDTLHLFRGLGSFSLTDDELVSAILKTVDAISNKSTYPKTVFVAMSFGKDYLEGPDIEDAIRETAKNTLSWQVVLAKDIEIGSNRTLTELIPELIKQSSIVVIDLHGSRQNVYYEAGIAHGLGKPTIFIAKEEDDVHFDLASHERIIWKNIRDLKTRLSAWLVKASQKC